MELPLDSWWYPTAGVPGWACGVSGAASQQLVVPHHGGTQLGVWSRPPAQSAPLARGRPGIDVAFPPLSLGAHPDCQDPNVPIRCAAYVAARTPVALDKHVFKSGRGDEAKKRKASAMQVLPRCRALQR